MLPAITHDPNAVRTALDSAMAHGDPTRQPPAVVPAVEQDAVRALFDDTLRAPEFDVEPNLIIEALTLRKVGLSENDISRRLVEGACERVARREGKDFEERLMQWNKNFSNFHVNHTSPWEISGGGVGANTLEVINEQVPQRVSIAPSADARGLVGELGACLKTLWEDPGSGIKAKVERRHGDATTVTADVNGVHACSLVPGEPVLRKMLEDPRPFDAVLEGYIAQSRKTWAEAQKATTLVTQFDMAEQIDILMDHAANDPIRILMNDPLDTRDQLVARVWQAIKDSPTMERFYAQMWHEYATKKVTDDQIVGIFSRHAVEHLVPPIPADVLEGKLRKVVQALSVPTHLAAEVVNAAMAALLKLDARQAGMVDIKAEVAKAMLDQGLAVNHVTQPMVSKALREPGGLIFADSNWGNSEHRVKFAMVVNPIIGKPEVWQMNEDGSDPKPLDKTQYVNNVWTLSV